jgi:uncharacterized membrane protein YjfL (UPF0719 family)
MVSGELGESALTISLVFGDRSIWGVLYYGCNGWRMATRLGFKDLVTDSSNNNLVSGLLLKMISLSFGILNAACIISCITY